MMSRATGLHRNNACRKCVRQSDQRLAPHLAVSISARTPAVWSASTRPARLSSWVWLWRQSLFLVSTPRKLRRCLIRCHRPKPASRLWISLASVGWANALSWSVPSTATHSRSLVAKAPSLAHAQALLKQGSSPSRWPQSVIDEPSKPARGGTHCSRGNTEDTLAKIVGIRVKVRAGGSGRQWPGRKALDLTARLLEAPLVVAALGLDVLSGASQVMRKVNARVEFAGCHSPLTTTRCGKLPVSKKDRADTIPHDPDFNSVSQPHSQVLASLSAHTAHEAEPPAPPTPPLPPPKLVEERPPEFEI
jgi:hypothetical protein